MNKKVNIKGKNFTVTNKMLFPSFAPHTLININKKEVKKILKENNCFLLRYSSNFDKKGKNNFWYIIKEKFVPLEEFSKNTRNQVKKGIKNCEVKKVNLNFIQQNCYDIYKLSLEAYNLPFISENEFKKSSLIGEIRDYWVVISKEEKIPIAYSENIIQEETCNYTYIKFHPNFQNHYPSYTLHYEMDKYYLEENKVKYVNVGAKSIYHQTKVQEFLVQKFKYRKAYCDLNIIYSKNIGFAVSILYPFRKIINKIPSSKLNKVNAILKQEESARN